jgi:hypothetical protein
MAASESQYGVLACLASLPACLRLRPGRLACLPACRRLADRARPRQDALCAEQQEARVESYVLEVSSDGILCMRSASGQIMLVPRYVRDGLAVAAVGGQSLTVARLVARAFHGPPPQPDWGVAHINGDLLDDRAANLVWVPPSHGEAP